MLCCITTEWARHNVCSTPFHCIQIVQFSQLLAVAEDILVHKDDSEPEWFWGADVTEDDGRYLVMSVSKDTSRVCQHVISFFPR